MTKQDYVACLSKEVETPGQLFAAFTGRACGIVKGLGSNDYKISELEKLIEALEVIEDVLYSKSADGL